jgi:hypothetical protein
MPSHIGPINPQKRTQIVKRSGEKIDWRAGRINAPRMNKIKPNIIPSPT